MGTNKDLKYQCCENADQWIVRKYRNDPWVVEKICDNPDHWTPNCIVMQAPSKSDAKKLCNENNKE